MMANNPAILFIRWFLRVPTLIVAFVIALVVLTCVGVSYSAYKTRQYYAELNELSVQADELEGEYEKLLLEQSAWAGYGRVDEISREALQMRAPLDSQIVVVSK